MTAWHTVHVRVNDADTGEPIPVRISFRAGGQTFAPFGRLADFGTDPGPDAGGHLLLGSERFFYIDGSCEVRLPAGEVSVEASRGPEYSPLRRTVTLGPGQISLRLAVQRWTDWRARGWYSGDTHVTGIGPHAAVLEGAAEDVAFVNLLACETESARGISNILAFSGQAPALERPGHLVAVNTLNRHPVLGSLALLNCHRAVYPLRFGGDRPDDWSLADWCDQCHRKKTGLVVWSAPQRLDSEALADLVLGKIDAFEVTAFDEPEPEALGAWYQLLAAGLRVPLVGGSGKDGNGVALGRVRTYAAAACGLASVPAKPQAAERSQIDYAAWIEAVRAGRTFVTNGPLLEFTAGDAGPGAVLHAMPGQRLPLRVELSSAWPCDRLEILVNGVVVASKEPSGDRQAALIQTHWAAEQSGWVAARCWGQDRLADGQCPFAQTSPAYVEVEGRPFQASPAVIESLVARLDEGAGWVARQARCETEHQRDHLLSQFSAARERLRGKATDG